MSENPCSPFFGLAPVKTLPAGQHAYQVREVCQGRVVSVLVTPYLPEALADLLLKARRPLNLPIHDGSAEDRVVTRVVPRPAALEADLLLELTLIDAFKPRGVVVLSAFEASGSEQTGLNRAARAYQSPHYGLAREKLARHLLSEADFHPDVARGMTCCAASQPGHPLWQTWEALVSS